MTKRKEDARYEQQQKTAHDLAVFECLMGYVEFSGLLTSITSLTKSLALEIRTRGDAEGKPMSQRKWLDAEKVQKPMRDRLRLLEHCAYLVDGRACNNYGYSHQAPYPDSRWERDHDSKRLRYVDDKAIEKFIAENTRRKPDDCVLIVQRSEDGLSIKDAY